MDYYNIIMESLERLIRWSENKEFYSVSVSFKIEVLEELLDNDESLIPHMSVQPITNERNELIDLRLSLGLFFEGDNEAKSKEKYDEIMGSRLGFMFGMDPVSKYNLSASIGKDVKMASALILYFVRLFSKSKEIMIKPLYYCSMVLNGNLSLLQHCPGIMPSAAVKNLMETMFEKTITVGNSLLFDILKDNTEYSEFLAEVSINKWHDGEGYTAWIHTGEINVKFLDAMFKRFVDYPNKYCAKDFNIQGNALDVRVEFYEDRINELIYFISDSLHMFYPSLNNEKILARVNYNYFSPVVHFYLNFYPDGKRPTDKELEYVYLLIDNLEYDVEEDEYYDPETK